MAAALASPYRIKGNRRRLRRRTSGRTIYAYVSGNPISRIDPFGLTQCDIDAAFAFAKKVNPDITFGAGAPKADIPRGGVEGEAQLRGGDGYIHLNERYLEVLDWSGVYNLLDTILHEGLHFTRPIGLQEKSNNYDHRYISPRGNSASARAGLRLQQRAEVTVRV